MQDPSEGLSATVAATAVATAMVFAWSTLDEVFGGMKLLVGGVQQFEPSTSTPLRAALHNKERADGHAAPLELCNGGSLSELGSTYSPKSSDKK